MKSCTVGLFSERLFPAFIREIMAVLWFFHWCLRIALMKLARAEFLEDAWLRITNPHRLHVPFMAQSPEIVDADRVPIFLGFGPTTREVYFLAVENLHVVGSEIHE